MKPKLITETEFPIYHDLQNWTIYEIPFGYQSQMTFLPRHQDLITVFVSGSPTMPQFMHGTLVNVGMDLIAYEPHPKPYSRFGPEPPINIYHVVLEKLSRKYGDYQYRSYGPFITGTLQDHWPKKPEDTLDSYCYLARPLAID
jgi:hypothetical protein